MPTTSARRKSSAENPRVRIQYAVARRGVPSPASLRRWADLVPLDVARQVARRLAGVKDVTAGGARGQIPRQVSLIELLDLTELSASRIVERWRQGGAGVHAPVGCSAAGTFQLDLRADGPHALVGGTTGAGKSELLQTVVASLALCAALALTIAPRARNWRRERDMDVLSCTES